MKFTQSQIVFGLALILLSSCAATKDEKKLAAKVGDESAVQTTDDLNKEGVSTIESAPGLTDDQRAKLLAIRKDTRAKRTALTKEELQLRAVLIKDIVSKNDTETEVKLIKDRIRKIEDERLTVLFTAIDQANKVLGNTAYQHQKELLETLRDDRGGRAE